MSKNPKQNCVWTITPINQNDAVFQMTFTKDQAMEFIIAMYKAINNPNIDQIVWSMNMYGFGNKYNDKQPQTNDKV